MAKSNGSKLSCCHWQAAKASLRVFSLVSCSLAFNQHSLGAVLFATSANKWLLVYSAVPFRGLVESSRVGRLLALVRSFARRRAKGTTCCARARSQQEERLLRLTNCFLEHTSTSQPSFPPSRHLSQTISPEKARKSGLDVEWPSARITFQRAIRKGAFVLLWSRAKRHRTKI